MIRRSMKTKDKNMITEELLAAFEEGKTNAEETALIEGTIFFSASLALVRVVDLGRKFIILCINE